MHPFYPHADEKPKQHWYPSMRFSIRDLLWLTVIVAMGTGWWTTSHALQLRNQAVNAERVAVIHHAQKLQDMLGRAKLNNDQLEEDVSYLMRHPLMTETSSRTSQRYKVDWSVLKEAIPAP